MPTSDLLLQNFQNWTAAWWARAAQITALEAMLLVALLCFALAVGVHLQRRARQVTDTVFPWASLRWMASLYPPLLTLLTFGVTSLLLQRQGPAFLLFPIALKLSVAWFSVRLVRKICRGEKLAGQLILFVILPATFLHLLGIWAPLMEVLHAVKFVIGGTKTNLYQLCKTLATLAALLSLTSLLMRGIEMRMMRLHRMRPSNRTLIIKIAQIALYVVVFLVALQILGISLAAFSVIGGALGVGIGFGLQKIASNFMSGIILLFEKSVEVDDLIELTDGTQGFIRQISARYTRIETPDDREIIIPNEDFITQRVISLSHTSTRGRVEILVDVTYSADYALAMQLMLEATRATSRCVPDPAPQVFVTQLAESGITLCLYFWIANVKEGRMEPRSQVLIAILKSFAEHGIAIAYPTREVRVVGDAAADPLTKHALATLS